MINCSPHKMFFTKGVGRHKDYLQSFELSLRDAGIEKCNIVTVSSIYPPDVSAFRRMTASNCLIQGKLLLRWWHATQQTNRTGWLLPPSVLLSLRTIQYTVIFPSTIRSVRPMNAQVSTRKDLRQRCWPQHLAFNLTLTQHGNEREKLFKMSGKIIRTLI